MSGPQVAAVVPAVVRADPERQVAPESARALLGAAGGAGRTCPAPGCGQPLAGRRRACSARCRAELSRLREAASRRAHAAAVLALLEQAEALEREAAGLRVEARARLELLREADGG